MAAADLAGHRFVITAGGTREPIDPVRYIGNHSSGKQGFALAEAALARGADVILIAANVSLDTPAGAKRVDVQSAVDMGHALEQETGHASVPETVIMAAAVADYQPAHRLETKMKRAGVKGLTIELVPTPDLLSGLIALKKPNQIIVGFAAETGDADTDFLEFGKEKAQRKGSDLTVINKVGGGQGFGTDDNSITVVDADGELVAVANGTKREVADVIITAITRLS